MILMATVSRPTWGRIIIGAARVPDSDTGPRRCPEAAATRIAAGPESDRARVY